MERMSVKLGQIWPKIGQSMVQIGQNSASSGRIEAAKANCRRHVHTLFTTSELAAFVCACACARNCSTCFGQLEIRSAAIGLSDARRHIIASLGRRRRRRGLRPLVPTGGHGALGGGRLRAAAAAAKLAVGARAVGLASAEDGVAARRGPACAGGDSETSGFGRKAKRRFCPGSPDRPDLSDAGPFSEFGQFSAFLPHSGRFRPILRDFGQFKGGCGRSGGL